MTNHQQINIFISHRHDDRAIALRIREELEALDDQDHPCLKFFLSEDILGGANWYKWIKERLVEANLLLLLFTDSSKNWNWCLYEAGLFDRLEDSYRRRIICLHSSHTTPPGPLQNLQAFNATPPSIRKFLKQLFVGTELLGIKTPLAKWLLQVPKKLEEVSQTISQLINRVPEKTNYFNKYLFIEVEDPTTLREDSLPSNAKVLANNETLAIFDKLPGIYTWGEIEEKARQNEDQRWLKELAEGIYMAARGEIPTPIQAIFHSRRDAKLYIPNLYRADTKADGSIEFKVLFQEEVSWQLYKVPEQMRCLITSLLMATRFKYELLGNYRPKIANGNTSQLFQKYCMEIRQVIEQIEGEATSRGLLERANLVESFTGRDREEVDGMYEQWYNIRNKLYLALKTYDHNIIRKSFETLETINRRYLELATQRYHEMITEEPQAFIGSPSGATGSEPEKPSLGGDPCRGVKDRDREGGLLRSRQAPGAGGVRQGPSEGRDGPRRRPGRRPRTVGARDHHPEFSGYS